ARLRRQPDRRCRRQLLDHRSRQRRRSHLRRRNGPSDGAHRRERDRHLAAAPRQQDRRHVHRDGCCGRCATRPVLARQRRRLAEQHRKRRRGRPVDHRRDAVLDPARRDGHGQERQSGRRSDRYVHRPEDGTGRTLHAWEEACEPQRPREDEQQGHRRCAVVHRQRERRRVRRRCGDGLGAGGRLASEPPARMSAGRNTLESPRLHFPDLARVASVGLRTRRMRAALSALGIAIGVAAIVAVLGLSSSSQAGLLAQIDKLGTNLLTVQTGQTLFGDTAELPLAAPGMISRIGPVEQVQYTGSTKANVYRSPLISSVNTNALSVQAASLDLPRTVGATIAEGTYLNPATAREPVAVLGYAAAQRLGIDRLYPGERVWLGGMWFYLAGILDSA